MSERERARAHEATFQITMDAPPPTSTTGRIRSRGAARRRRVAAAAAIAAVALLLLASSGIGATSASSTVLVTADVNDTISITDPVSLDASPAPSADAAWTSGTPDLLDLGQLQGSEVQSASATWQVSTTAVNGYTVQLSNPGAAPVLQSGANSFPDMCAIGAGCPGALNTGTSAFGVAIGDATAHAQVSVPPTWGTTGGGGTQGTLYAGVPTAGMVIAQRATNVSNDPVTITFAAVSNVGSMPPSGTYVGTVQLLATSL